MRWTGTLRLRVRSLFRSSQVERELDEELQYHLQHLVDDYVAAGMSPPDARYKALREMGAIEQRRKSAETHGVSRSLTRFGTTSPTLYEARGATRSTQSSSSCHWRWALAPTPLCILCQGSQGLRKAGIARACTSPPESSALSS